MKKCGLNTPIDVVPLGVNTDVFTYKERSYPIKNDKFRFLLYANSHWENERKNYQQTCDAFLKAFKNQNDVELILKLTEGQAPPIRNSKIRIIYNRLADSDLNFILHSVHAFVFVSSGEGFGLPPREAMSTGLPVVLGNTSALQDIAIDKYCYPVQPSGTKAPKAYPGIYGPAATLGTFDTYKTSDIIDAMKSLYNNYREALSIGKRASELISQEQTYKHTAKRITELLGRRKK